MDIAPNYAGTLMAITNTVANLIGGLAPMIVGQIIDGHVSNFIFFTGCLALKRLKKISSNRLKYAC